MISSSYSWMFSKLGSLCALLEFSEVFFSPIEEPLSLPVNIYFFDELVNLDLGVLV